jgi:hypothetical protein
MNQIALDFSGREIGHAKAHQAADHAGPQWQADAIDALRSFACKHHQFTVEDVRSAFPSIKAPTDKAWGAVVLMARKEGFIAAVGNVKVAGGRMVATLWQSRIA